MGYLPYQSISTGAGFLNHHQYHLDHHPHYVPIHPIINVAVPHIPLKLPRLPLKGRVWPRWVFSQTSHWGQRWLWNKSTETTGRYCCTELWYKKYPALSNRFEIGKMLKLTTVPSVKLRWQSKITILNRVYIFKGLFLRCHVSFRGWMFHLFAGMLVEITGQKPFPKEKMLLMEQILHQLIRICWENTTINGCQVPTVEGSEIRRSPVEVASFFPLFARFLFVFSHPRWWSPDFWTINSMKEASKKDSTQPVLFWLHQWLTLKLLGNDK